MHSIHTLFVSWKSQAFRKKCTFWFLCNLELENRNKQTKAKTEK